MDFLSLLLLFFMLILLYGSHIPPHESLLSGYCFILFISSYAEHQTLSFNNITSWIFRIRSL